MNSHRAKWKTRTNHSLNTRIKGKIQQGFTVIEAIIVVVVAAIILLAVFLVIPQLQRSQRNSRALAVSRQIASAAITYRTQQGAYPTCAATCTDITNITGSLKSPAGTDYSFVTVTLPANNKEIMIINTGACGASPSATPNISTGTKFIVVIFQETSSSTGSTLCYETP